MEFLKTVKRKARGFLGTPCSPIRQKIVPDHAVPPRDILSPQSLMIMIAAAVLLLGSALPSFAITAPTSGSLFYDIYDIVVNSMLKGAIGFVAAILVFMMGIGLFFVQKIIPGIIGVLCAALIIKADTIVMSLGLIF